MLCYLYKKYLLIIGLPALVGGFLLGIIALNWAGNHVSISKSDAFVYDTRARDQGYEETCQYWSDVLDNCGGGWSGMSCRFVARAAFELVGCGSMLEM